VSATSGDAGELTDRGRFCAEHPGVITAPVGGDLGQTLRKAS
jgi:hypothetical protein